MPTVTPATVAITVVTIPTNRDIRAPYRIRTSRSRPVPSVPSKNPFVPGPTGRPAAVSPLFGYAVVGGWPVSAANAGAAMASPTMMTMTISDATATLSWRSRRQVSCHWLRPSIACSGADSAARASNSSSVMLTVTPYCPRPRGSRRPEPGNGRRSRG